MSGISGAGGIESSQPQEQMESAEKSTEVREAAESIEKAALKPEEKVEEGDFQAAENLEEAFKAAVPPPEQAATTAAVTASPGIEISEVSSEAPSRSETTRTAESNAEEFLEEVGQPEMQAAVETVPESESTEQTQSQAMSDLKTVERDDSETKLVKDGGDDDKFKPDDGLEQAGDIREDTQISDQYGDDVIETGDGVDTLRDPAQPGEGIDDIPNTIPDLADFTPGEGGGKKPGDLDGPDVGLNQDGERGDLEGAAAFGADSRISGTSGEAGPALLEFEHQMLLNEMGVDNADEVAAAGANAQIEEAQGYGDTYYSEVMEDIGQQYGGDDSGGKKTADGNTITEKDVQGGTDQNASSGIDPDGDGPTDDIRDGRPRPRPKEEVKKTTPDPEGGDDVDFDPTTLDGKLRAQAFSNLSSIDQDLDGEAVSQPVDEDGASPKEPGIAFDQATQTDPYSQDTIDGADVPSSGYIPEEKSKFTPGMAGGDDGLLDPDFGVSDPNKPTGEPDDSGDEGPKPTKPD